MRPDPDERDALLHDARALGIDNPFARGVYLRHNWGRCVFYDDGCRLHREIGVHAKPRVCRQFPFVFGRSDDGTVAKAIDPACFHATAADPEESPDVQGSAAVRPANPPVQTTPVPPHDRDGLWADVSIGETIRERLIALPLVALLDGPHLGPLTTDLLTGLDRATPRTPTTEERALLDPRITTALQFALLPVSDPIAAATDLVGGSQLFLGARRPVGPGFAAWVRLLRTGVF